MRACPKCGIAKNESDFKSPEFDTCHCKACNRIASQNSKRRERASRNNRTRKERLAKISALGAGSKLRIRKGDCPTGSKWCSKCREFLLFESFGRRFSKKDGLYPMCRKCRNLKQNAMRDMKRGHCVYDPVKSLALEGLRFCERCEKSKPLETFSGTKGKVCKDCKIYQARNSNQRKGLDSPLAIKIINSKKECTRCARLLTLDHFNRSSRAASGHESLCRDCNKDKQFLKRSNKRSIETFFGALAALPEIGKIAANQQQLEKNEKHNDADSAKRKN